MSAEPVRLAAPPRHLPENAQSKGRAPHRERRAATRLSGTGLADGWWRLALAQLHAGRGQAAGPDSPGGEWKLPSC